MFATEYEQRAGKILQNRSKLGHLRLIPHKEGAFLLAYCGAGPAQKTATFSEKT